MPDRYATGTGPGATWQGYGEVVPDPERLDRPEGAALPAAARGPRRRPRRDRHGRGLRTELVPASVPSARTRSQRFDGYVLDAVARLEPRWADPLSDVDVAVELVPPSDPSPWEEQVAPLGRVFPAEAGRRARLVVYRRPVEARADDDLPRLVHEVVVEQVATLLGRTPEEIDPTAGAD